MCASRQIWDESQQFRERRTHSSAAKRPQEFQVESLLVENANERLLVGVISDTHGLLRPEAVEALRGSDRILHAGDVGDPKILDELARIAPVTAIRGNIDTEPWANTLPKTKVVEAGNISIYMLHNLCRLDLKLEAAGFRVVLYGHSHKPNIEEKNGVLYFNPGSAGPRRFHLPVSAGRLIIQSGKVRAELIEVLR